MKLMKKKNFYTNQLQIKKSLRTKIYEFLKDEIKKEGIKKKSDEELSNIFNSEFDVLLIFEDEKLIFPSSKPLINLNFLTKGFARSE